MPTNDYSDTAGQYGAGAFDGTIHLGFRDIASMVPPHLANGRALDYGCGAGRSTRFLKSIGFDAAGVDISPGMLATARKADPDGTYVQIASGRIPYGDGAFDLVLSSFVFLEIDSREELERVSADIFRVLKPGGAFILVTVAEAFYAQEWLTIATNFPENRDPVSGARMKVHLRDVDLELTDYYWTDSDYRDVLTAAGFTDIDLHQPIGKPEDGIDWITEDRVPPFSIYVAR